MGPSPPGLSMSRGALQTNAPLSAGGVSEPRARPPRRTAVESSRGTTTARWRGVAAQTVRPIRQQQPAGSAAFSFRAVVVRVTIPPRSSWRAWPWVRHRPGGQRRCLERALGLHAERRGWVHGRRHTKDKDPASFTVHRLDTVEAITRTEYGGQSNVGRTEAGHFWRILPVANQSRLSSRRAFLWVGSSASPAQVSLAFLSSLQEAPRVQEAFD